MFFALARFDNEVQALSNFLHLFLREALHAGARFPRLSRRRGMPLLLLLLLDIGRT